MMANAKRLYVYGVMGAALVPLLWGLTSVLRLTVRWVAATVGSRDVVGAEVALDELSLALALVIVAVPVWLIHVWLAQRPLAGSTQQALDERASPARATYFFLVLTIAGGIALLQLYASLQELFRAALTDERTWGVAGAVAALVVTGAAWLGHLWWRRADLRAAPARLADDWLSLKPPPELYEFLHHGYRRLSELHGTIYGTKIPAPKLYAVNGQKRAGGGG